MAKFCKTVEIHNLPAESRARLQPGQHITAGGAPGRWRGQTKAGVDVAAWRGNAGRHPSGRMGYFRALRQYAQNNGAA